jgi:hypothetical protein
VRREAEADALRAAEGWYVVTVRLVEGESPAAEVLGTLIAQGMRISRMEAVSASLAELISTVVAREGGPA